MAKQFISIQVTKPPRGLAKAAKRGLNIGMIKALRWWHQSIAPKHFEPSAVSKYGYEKRTKRYMQRKAVQKHHQKPLVWTGAMREAVLGQTSNVTVRGKRATLRLEGLPDYANIKSKASKLGGSRRQPNKARELTFVTQPEVDEMMERILREIQNQQQLVRAGKRA